VRAQVRQDQLMLLFNERHNRVPEMVVDGKRMQQDDRRTLAANVIEDLSAVSFDIHSSEKFLKHRGTEDTEGFQKLFAR